MSNYFDIVCDIEFFPVREDIFVSYLDFTIFLSSLNHIIIDSFSLMLEQKVSITSNTK